MSKEYVVVSKEAIEKSQEYMIHKSDCDHIDGDAKCSCGLTEIFDTLSAAQPLSSYEQKAFDAGREEKEYSELNVNEQIAGACGAESFFPKYNSFSDYQNQK